MGFFIVAANVIGVIFYKKKRNLYFASFTVLLSAVLFGAIGGVLALLVIRDAFAIFYGLQVGYYLFKAVPQSSPRDRNKHESLNIRVCF